ncbi:MAG: cytidine/deoxycytidylate deaminase family protein [Bacilli bacterium]|nr:cytidine/deoxycytidylate deaminase family protein [Bacilli bacterium]
MKDDSYYMNYAVKISPAANCIKGKVGAVIVRDGEILSEGVNSVPNGVTPCTEETCIRKKLDLHAGQNQELCFVVHAEQNALINALNKGVNVQDSTIYVTKKPCIICGKMLINAGIKRIVYLQDYADKYSEGILKEAGIELEKYEGEINN